MFVLWTLHPAIVWCFINEESIENFASGCMIKQHITRNNMFRFSALHVFFMVGQQFAVEERSGS
jgi:hypothetical protein